ncbi:MAG TPA: hypothetical protein VLI93_01070, partial [Acetobacteraceae bacterium]|nr:hypothetical protein [Acetobacteraceae bacterium]
MLLDLPNLFTVAADPAPRVRASRPVHISGYAREADDFYPTPAWVTECLLNNIDLRGPVWEPCCGDGAIARVVAARNHQVVATDLEDHGFGRPAVDFYTCRHFPADCRSLLTNPPYGDGSIKRTGPASARFLRGFVRHAIDLTMRADGQLALLVRFQWIAGRNAAALIASGPLDTVLVITKRIIWFDRGKDTN